MGSSGFGSPSGFGSQPPYDWGFGTRTPASWDEATSDSGFGARALQLVLAGVLPSAAIASGGEIILLRGDFTLSGVYVARFIDADGNDRGTGFSGRPGEGNQLRPNGALDELQLVPPPLAPGTYSIQLEWGAGLIVLLEGVLRVLAPPRASATYRLRRRFPLTYRTGPRSVRAELDGTEIT